jgi:hypothetical protein
MERILPDDEIQELVAFDDTFQVEPGAAPSNPASCVERDLSEFLSKPEHTITWFPNQFAREKKEWASTLDQLAEQIRSTTGESKADLPFLEFAIFGDQQTDKGCYRSNANVKWITGVEADYDAGSLTFEAAVSRLREVGVAGLIYTTPSYTEEKPRWRVLCPASEILPPSERGALMDRINGVFDGEFAGESWTMSQSYYFGNITGRTPVRVAVVKGAYIDRRPDLPAIPKPGGNRTEAREHPDAELVASNPISIEQLRAMGQAAEGPCTDLHYDVLRVVIWGVMRMAVEGDKDKAIRREVACTIWDANTASESKTDAKFEAILTAPMRCSSDGRPIGPGSFVHYAKLGGWQPPRLTDEGKYGPAWKWEKSPADLNLTQNLVSTEPAGGAITVSLSDISCIAGSDDDLATGFALRHRDRLRYVDEWGHWRVFDGRCWIPLPTPAVWNVIRAELRGYAAGSGANLSDSKRQKLLSKPTISNVEALARGDLIASDKIFDADPWLLNTPGGIVDLCTGELRPSAPKAHCTKMVAVTPGGECPRWKQFLSEITGGDTELEGYLLTRTANRWHFSVVLQYDRYGN